MLILAALQFDDMIYNYGRFHNDRINQAIHFVFIPIITFTLFILGAIHGHSLHVSILDGIVVPGGVICVETWTLFVVTVACYFVADFGTAVVTTLWSGAMLIASHHIVVDDAYSTYIVGDNSYPLKDVALYLHVAAWLVQFYGHGVHEGRAPALASNLLYALLAPFFITFEFLNGAFGYREDKIGDIRKRIEADVAEFRRGKGRKRQ